jgi:hypothetical protein
MVEDLHMGRPDAPDSTEAASSVVERLDDKSGLVAREATVNVSQWLSVFHLDFHEPLPIQNEGPGL